MKITDKILVKRVTVPAAIDTIWWKWTTPEGLRTFFGAENNMELRVGGPYEIYFSLEPPEGLRGSEGCEVLGFLPKRMLCFSWNAPPEFPEIRNGDYKTWVVVMMAGDGHETTLEIHHLGWPDGDDWQGVYDYFDRAWEVVMDWLKESLE